MLVTGEGIREWVEARLPYVAPLGDKSETMGVVVDGKLLAGVVYTNYTDTDIHMTIASDSPRWASRRAIAGLLAYPFLQLKVRRVTAITKKKNQQAQKFLRRLGFMHEGTIHDAFEDDDAYLFGMTKRYYLRSKWHYGKKNS